MHFAFDGIFYSIGDDVTHHLFYLQRIGVDIEVVGYVSVIYEL